MRGGQLIRLPVMLFSEGEKGAHTVTASAYDIRGNELTGVSFPVMADRDRAAGELTVNLPNADCLLLIRVKLISPDGAEVSRADALLPVYAGKYPLAALMNPERAALRADAEGIQNVGEHVALCLFTPGASCGPFSGYGALLPGEKLALPGYDILRAECLN